METGGMETGDISTQMLFIMIVWVAMVVIVVRSTMRSSAGTIGLPAAYLFATTFLYIGAITYIVPGYSQFATGNLYLKSYDFTESTVIKGTLATLIGIAGFTIGTLLVRSGTNSWRSGEIITVGENYRRALVLGLAGLGVTGFLLNMVHITFPMKDVFLQVGRNAAVVVICLGAVLAVRDGRGYKSWAMWAAVIPLTYLIVWGFVSYGFIVFTIFVGFWFSILASRRLSRKKIAFSAFIITYVLLSVFVGYMSFRAELREVIWGGAGYGERVSAIFNAFANTKLLNPFDFESLDWLNIRLNQYIFVGKAIEYHDQVPDLWLNGKSLLLSLIAWIPRVFWPGKPQMGGNHFVAEHTGMTFSDSATFGAGPVFEFYVNFGYVGIFIGFVVLGYILRLIDARASISLRQGRLHSFARLFTVGISIIAPLSEIFFVVSSAVASWLVIDAMARVIRTIVGDNGRSLPSNQSFLADDPRQSMPKAPPRQ